MTAAREYRDVVGELERAAEALRESDEARAAQLTRALSVVDAELQEAERRAALARLGVELGWDAVVDALWAESWMTLRPRPQPARDVDPARIDDLDAEVERTAAAVEAAVRRWFDLGPR
jgi:hypothetical protein